MGKPDPAAFPGFPPAMTPDRFLSVLRAFLSYLAGPLAGLADDDRARAAGLLRALPLFAVPGPEHPPSGWSWTPPPEPGVEVRRVRPVERYPGDNSIWFNRVAGGWRLVMRGRAGDVIEWLQVVAAAGSVYGGRQLVDATDECGRCGRPFDGTDPAFDGRARSGETLFCRRCADRCHESTDFAHSCAVCSGPTVGGAR